MKSDMIDFDPFVKEYGAPAQVEKASEDILYEYKDKLPVAVIEFWRRFGFGCYADGLLWVVNPKQLQDVLSEWLPKKGNSSSGVPIVRTAFGSVVFWQDDKFTALDVHHSDQFDAGDDAEILFNFFLIGEDARLGFLDGELFEKALKKFGPLKSDEMYGYKLPLAMGGAARISNMARMKLREQLSILAQARSK